jgi:hypothetical protein
MKEMLRFFWAFGRTTVSNEEEAGAKGNGDSGEKVTTESPKQNDPLEDRGGNGQPFPVVGIGSSAGGLEALKKFFSSTPADAIVANLREAEPGRKVEIEVQQGLTASADQTLMEIVLSNLIRNAWKFTSKTVNARITFGQIDKDAAMVFYVKDNGAGFDPSQKAKMFHLFQRLHPEKEFEGTGIGLATVERIIRTHGGRVWAEGEVDKGVTVYFMIGGH